MAMELINIRTGIQTQVIQRARYYTVFENATVCKAQIGLTSQSLQHTRKDSWKGGGVLQWRNMWYSIPRSQVRLSKE